MKIFKKTFIKFIILILIFIAVIAAYTFINYNKPDDNDVSMDLATLPIISVDYESTNLNLLHGHITSMDSGYMRDSITPIDSNHSLNLNVHRYENTIASISYELRSLDTTRLIEDTQIDTWQVDGENVHATLKLSNIIEKNKEYILIIKLVTEKHGTINYYTRVIEQDNSNVTKQIEFISNFSKSTLNADEFEPYINYLEINTSSDNTNLAKVDIHSRSTNVTWGNLSVERVTEPIVNVVELTDDMGSYQLKYKVRAKNDYDTHQYYNVTEYFTVKSSGSTMYLFVYERTAEQIFDPTSQNVSTTRINLGLDSDLSLNYKYNEKGSTIAFVKNGSLWCMDMKENRIISLFSFENMTSSDLRLSYNQYDIEIVSVDEDGNIMFIVYGYMEKGRHEGSTGVALYRYSYKENDVDELVFVPSSTPFNVLKESVGKFAYLTDDELLYFMIGNSIYTVTMDSNEYVQLVTGLKDGNYIINQTNSILAWHENVTINDADSIRIIDVAAKNDYTIKASEGEKIKLLGFIGNDLIYGTAKTTDIHTDTSGNTIFPMYKLNVVIYDQDEPEEYKKDNIYISNVSVKDNILSLTRLSKDESGNFVSIEEDKLVNRIANTTNIVDISTIATDLKKKELILTFAYTVSSDNKFSSIETNTINFTAQNKLNLSDSSITVGKFYVFAKGTMSKSFSTARGAIEYAYDLFGTVIDEVGNVIWMRTSKPTLAKLSNTSILVNKKYSSLEDIKNDTDYNVIDLTGTDIANVLYYAPKDFAVITKINDLGLVILSAYSTYLGSVDVFAFTSLETGEITKYDYDVAIAKMQECGNVFLALIPTK